MQYWAITDPGCVRPQNQDAYKAVRLDRNTLLCVVCDGVGGAKSGNVASTLAADIFCQDMASSWKKGLDEKDAEDLMRKAAKLANFTVLDQAREVEDFRGMATTMVALLLRGQQATVLNIGDSRAYHIGSTGIRQLTTDHTLVQMRISRGEMTPEEAERAPDKHVITRAIGADTSVLCDLYRLDVTRGDHLLLCSDGLSNLVDEQEILFEIIHGEDAACCQRLLDIAKNRGAPDNLTSILVRV